MQWWCSAQGVAWSWTWQPYVGVWLFVLALALAYRLLVRRTPPREDRRRRRAASWYGGVLLLWLALDWPVGALGAGYLASVHMLQFLLIAMAAPPLLLYGLPTPALRALARRRRVEPALRFLTNPIAAILLFNAVVVATHWPSVVDTLMASQLGSFSLDMAWLAAGLLFWWPLVCEVPSRPRFSDVARVGYLIANTIFLTAPFAFLTFAELPFYATYELAPPVSGLPTRTDQQLAGLLMKLGGGAILWTAVTVLFFRWWAREEGTSGGPAGTGATGGPDDGEGPPPPRSRRPEAAGLRRTRCT